MSVLSKLVASLQAGDLATPFDPPFEDRMLLRDVSKTSLEWIEHRPKPIGRSESRPWSQSPCAAPTSLSCVLKDGKPNGLFSVDFWAARCLAAAFNMEQASVDKTLFEKNKTVGEVALPLEKLTRIPAGSPAIDAAVRLGESGHAVALVEKDGELFGFIKLGSFLDSAFSLPLLGLLLEIEEAALQLVEINASESWKRLTPGRQEQIRPRAEDEFIKYADLIKHSGVCSLPVDHMFKAFLFPEEYKDLMHNQIEDAGAPYEMALQMTTFADKFTILRKRKILPEFSGMSLRRYQFRAKAVRNAIAHGRAWWSELKSAADLTAFIAENHAMLARLNTLLADAEKDRSAEQ